jgi:ABC-2 type transport system ATP-binding protein
VPRRPAVVEVEGLRKSYGDTHAVRGIDLTIAEGEVLAMLGPNGAGKTTTVEILEGYRTRDAGRVSILGMDPSDAGPELRRRIGIVLQSCGFEAYLTVAEMLEMHAGYYPHPRPVDEMLALVGLEEKAGSRVRTLSGGQRRRLDVAVGIVGRPELLFLDEPTAGFDPQARRDFHHLVHRLSDLEATTILLTTHDLDEAEKLADRVLILAGGRIVADDSADGLARRVEGEAEVKWTRDGERFVHAAADPTAFVRKLLAQHTDGISDLEVRRANLEDAYLSLVQQHEAGQTEAAAEVFEEVTR